MNLKLANILLGAAIGIAATGCAEVPVYVPANTGEPVLNVSPYRHGNLAAAQELVRGAYDKLSDAQFANHAELGGHAARAKELLREAGDEIKLAAIAANER
jgi:hypothetical protein